MVSILWCHIPVEAKAWEGAQFNARGESSPDETRSRLQPRENIFRARNSLHRRDENIRVSKFLIHFYISNIDLFQARVTDLTDSHLREFLADTVRNTLKTGT